MCNSLKNLSNLIVITYLHIIIFEVNFLNSYACVSSNYTFENYSCDDSTIITVKNYDADILYENYFSNLKENLTDIHLINFHKLFKIEKNTFNRFSELRFLSISKAPLLRNLSLDILETDINKLRFLEITKTGLFYLPKIRLQKKLLEMLNFEGNSIQIITTNNIMVAADVIIFHYNKIESIQPWAFNNSNISKISLKHNRKLQILAEDAFYGLRNLIFLDLSETSVKNIPSSGLEELETLIIKQTYSLKTIPSIYDFVSLTRAELTFSFHCCAFLLPQRHDPTKYAFYQDLSKNITKLCIQLKTDYSSNNSTNKVLDDEDEQWYDAAVTPGSNEILVHEKIVENFLRNRNQNIRSSSLIALCGTLHYKKSLTDCTPVPNSFNPCEDIMGYEWLRICVWFVVSIGLFGNLCVLAVILCKPTEIKIQNFLISNLAFSDLCMAIFLFLIAKEDLLSRGHYFNYAYNWQQGIGCQIAGFVTIFSSQLSIFMLCLLTMERWFTIKKALYLNTLTFQKVIYITIYGWLYALIMASLPLFGISSYSTTSLCLPMDTENKVDKAYVLTLLLVVFSAFVIICTCYVQIYFSLSYETRHKNGEYVLARKIAILVTTNFICWAPITFFAFTAVLGFPLINITNSKILLVFFYPLNACANPFLYAILTTNFKKNFVHLFSKFGICEKTVQKYKLIYYQPSARSKNVIQRPSTSQTAV